MSKSAERLPLRLLTPGILLFLLAHMLGALVGQATPETPAALAKPAQYAEGGDGSARATRPPRVQIRTSRTAEPGRGFDDRLGFLGAALAYVAVAAGLHAVSASAVDRPSVHAPQPSNIALLRAQNPRDPPAA